MNKSMQMPQQQWRLNPFDRLVAVAAIGVLALILLTIALGDRVGVTIERAAPLGTARATAPIILTFSEPMARDSLGDRLRITPDVAGEVSWSGASLIFRPSTVLEPGITYEVSLLPGTRSESGREVLAEYRFSFAVQRPRVAYLAPADASPINIWIAEPGVAGSERSLTNSLAGIFDFAVSPDGQYIAFAETNAFSNTEDIKLLDLETGEIRQLTNCQDASCTNPNWRPDGRVIAYERVEYNSALQGQGVGVSPTRVWLIDVTANPATTSPLFSDSQIVGYDPQWSADGQRLALFDRGNGAILIYDFSDDSGMSVPTRAGTSGALKPDGLQLVFPQVILQEGSEARTALQVADLVANAVAPLPGSDESASDEAAVWTPDGTLLAVGRRYLDERFTRGYQIVLIDPVSGTITQLTEDPRYTNGFFTWDARGEQLVIQRLPLFTEDGQPDNLARPEIWTYDRRSGEMVLVATNGFHPRWLP
jgi:Tol biopolymer transport system component